MLKNELLQDGQYAALPKTIMALPERLLPATAKLIFMTLLERLGTNEVSWPGYGTICTDTGLGRTAAINNVEYMAAAGLIRKTVGGIRKDGSHESNRYEILNAKPTHESILASLKDSLENRDLKSKLRQRIGEVVRQEHQEGSAPRTLGVVRQEHQGWCAENTRVVRSAHQGSVLGAPEQQKGTTEETTEREQQNLTTTLSAADAAAVRQEIAEKSLVIEGEESSEGDHGEIVNHQPPEEQPMIDCPVQDQDQVTAGIIAERFSVNNPEELTSLIKLWRKRGHVLTPATAKRLPVKGEAAALFEKTVLDATGSTGPAWKKLRLDREKSNSYSLSIAPGETAVDLWTGLGLNSIHDRHAVVRVIAPAALDLCTRLGDHGYSELLSTAIAKRVDPSFRLDSPRCQSIEWLFQWKTQNGQKVYNIEALAAGTYNWIPKQKVVETPFKSMDASNCDW